MSESVVTARSSVLHTVRSAVHIWRYCEFSLPGQVVATGWRISKQTVTITVVGITSVDTYLANWLLVPARWWIVEVAAVGQKIYEGGGYRFPDVQTVLCSLGLRPHLQKQLLGVGRTHVGLCVLPLVEVWQISTAALSGLRTSSAEV